jgi:hypothetical protein
MMSVEAVGGNKVKLGSLALIEYLDKYHNKEYCKNFIIH